MVVTVAVAAACTGATPADPNPSATQSPASGKLAAATLQPEDLVDLTVYFRTGEGPHTHLVKVVREVPVTDDLPRRALDLLLDGPMAEDGRDLDAALPTTTRVRSMTVDGGTASVDLSAAVITDARTVGQTAVNELMALGALANTLTEFPTIDQVRLSVEGSMSGRVGSVDVGAFWGSWGLPEVLVRDESLVGSSSEGEAVTDLAAFTRGDQTTGAPDAGEVQVTSVRIRDRVAYLRVVVELADPHDVDMSAKAPPSRARERNGELLLEVNDVVAYSGDLGPGQLLQVGDPGFGAARVQFGTLPGALRVHLTPTTARAYWLHTLSGPTRIVLDVKKTPLVTDAGSGDTAADS
jgi:hypothetical protein